MPDFITHNLEYVHEDMLEYFLKPMFVDNDIREIITIRDDIKTEEKLDYIGKISKVTKAYKKGTAFTASSGPTITQRTLRVGSVKSQVHQHGRAFLNWVKQHMLRTGVDMNNIDGTVFEQILVEVWVRALARDLQAQLFFADPTKEVLDGTTGAPTGVLDEDYAIENYEGFFKKFKDEIASGLIPSAQVIDLNTATYQTTVAVKQEETITLTGTSGTANVNINGTDYLATFDTDLATTVTNFVSTHGATITGRFGEVAVVANGADIELTSGQAGLPISASVANASGNLAGSVATATANVKNVAGLGGLQADAAKKAMEAMYEAMTAELEALEEGAEFIVTKSIYNNYMVTLETANGIPAAYQKMIDGQDRLMFRGIPLMVRKQWDAEIKNDFGGVSPHRLVLTTKSNLVAGTDGTGDTGKFEIWYDRNEQENRMRCEYMSGTQFVHEDFLVIAQ